ncbi:MAG TPA: TPM domain-containing protein [Candidatus Binatia bacterium]|nr:TPM domain-containing protein [Candidatus Binatia bacterium]
MILLGLILLANFIFCSSALALELPPLETTVNDLAGVFPKASFDELKQTLMRFKKQTGHTVVVLTIKTLEGENIESVGRKAFDSLPLAANDLSKAVLLVVARGEREVAVEVGDELRPLFPAPDASQKLQAQVELYVTGWRPDLGIHGAVSYIFRVIRGEVRFDRVTEEEKLENASVKGSGAGAIFAFLLAPYLAFVTAMLWGIYATHYHVHTETRLFIGAVLGGGTAKIVALLMGAIGHYDDGLWYFILAVSIPLGIFGSLTEYWMAGEWRGIPRVKGEGLRRKPTDKMGI